MYRGKHIRRRGWWIAGTWILIILVALLVLMPFLEPYLLEVDRHELLCADLPQDIKQLRVVYLSDIHQGGFPWFTQARTDDLVAQIKLEKPDLIILGGDYADDPAGA